MTVILIAGGSGSGKSTLARNLLTELGEHNCALIAHDSYYRDQSDLPMNQRIHTNYDHPESLETELLVEHISQLKAGNSVSVPIYDFAHHTRDLEAVQEVHPTKYLIVEGILLLADEGLRNVADLRVFLDVTADIRLIRRMQRDVEERGRTYEFCISQYLDFTRPMHEKFVAPSKEYADIVVVDGGENKEGILKIVQTLHASINLSDLV